VQLSAARAARALFREHFAAAPGAAAEFARSALPAYLAIAEDAAALPYARRGACLALGELPAPLLAPALSRVVAALVACSRLAGAPESRDAETRRNACQALGAVGEALSEQLAAAVELPAAAGGGAGPLVALVADALVASLDDYAVDKRGDVGAWVRAAAMRALARVLPRAAAVAADPSRPLPQLHAALPPLVERAVLALLKQLVEKIDRMRECAGGALRRLLDCRPPLPGVPEERRLRAALAAVDFSSWQSAAGLFRAIVPFLRLPRFASPLLEGLVVCLGGLAESLERDSTNALVALLGAALQEEDAPALPPPPDAPTLPEDPAGAAPLRGLALVARVFDELLGVLRKHRGDPRMVLPTFKAFDTLLQARCFDALAARHPERAEQLLALTAAEIRATRDFMKLLGAIGIFLGVAALDVPTQRPAALSGLMGLLAHAYPKVRAQAAEQMYARLVGVELGLDEDALDSALALLAETQWAGDLAGLAPRIHALCDRLGVPRVHVALEPEQPARRAHAAAQRDTLSYQEYINSLR
jgi:hypothetical protein